MPKQNRMFISKTSLAFSLNFVLMCSFLAVMLSFSSSNILSATVGENNNNSQQPNINAASIYNKGQMILPNNVKHLVILLPNEAHESQHPGHASSEQRLINQTYVPQKTIVGPDTMVIWFNGDADHDHKIILTNDVNPENIIFDSGVFAFNEASRPVLLNDTGTFNYYETGANEEDTDFVMNGTISVVDRQDLNANTLANTPTASSSNTSSTLSKGDTAGVLMVPTEDTGTYVQELEMKGFAIDSTHNFNDIRAGDQQTLLVWTTSGMNLDEVFSVLQEITPELPYS